jgi:hypothetical protein
MNRRKPTPFPPVYFLVTAWDITWAWCPGFCPTYSTFLIAAARNKLGGETGLGDALKSTNKRFGFCAP